MTELYKNANNDAIGVKKNWRNRDDDVSEITSRFEGTRGARKKNLLEWFSVAIPDDQVSNFPKKFVTCSVSTHNFFLFRCDAFGKRKGNSKGYSADESFFSPRRRFWLRSVGHVHHILFSFSPSHL